MNSQTIDKLGNDILLFCMSKSVSTHKCKPHNNHLLLPLMRKGESNGHGLVFFHFREGIMLKEKYYHAGDTEFELRDDIKLTDGLKMFLYGFAYYEDLKENHYDVYKAEGSEIWKSVTIDGQTIVIY